MAADDTEAPKPASPDGGAPVAAGNAGSDATHWHRDEFLELAERSAGIGVWDVELATGLARGRPQFFRIMGLEPTAEPIPIETFRRLRYPEDLESLLAGFRRAVDSGADHYEMEYRIRRPDGQTRWIFGRGRIVRDRDGKAVRYSGVDIDITERKAAEAALAESEERMRLAMAAGGLGHFEIDLGSWRVRFSTGLAELFALPAGAADWPLSEWLAGMAPEDRAGARAALEGTAASGGKTATFEFRLPRRHGPVRRFEARAATFADRRGVPARMIGVTVDVTERRAAADALARINEELEARVRERTAALEAEAAKRAQAEARLQQAQKMEALGQLTGGIAHDFNNVLSAIANNIELARRDGDPVRQRHHMASALTAVESGAKLVRQLLVFARKHPVNVHPVAVNEVIGGMASMLRRTCSEEIEFEFRLDDRVGWVNADPYQLQTVLLNLVVNARDAMPEGGSIAIETGLAAREPAGGGEYVCVAVADTGTGMTPEVLRQAFEPFFTTKEIGKGTGLGLSMVLGAMRQIGGDVTIDSAPGRGTTVRLYFPCAAAPSAEGAGAEPAGGGESSGAAIPVLFVEDDLLINVSTAELLEGAGYVVHAAARADQALALLDAHPEIRLLITDIGLPQVSGRALADEARRRRPGLKVLFVTGYDRTGLGEAVPPDPAVAYLAKPYQTAELFAAIKRLRQARCEGTGGGASEAG